MHIISSSSSSTNSSPSSMASVSNSTGTMGSTLSTLATTVVNNGNYPFGTTGVCIDGTYTEVTHHQGACSHHGGISQWVEPLD